MDKIIKYIKIPLLTISILLIYWLGLSFLNYVGFLSLTSIVKINFVVVAVLMFLIGLFKGKKASKKGYLEGLKLGTIIIFILFILNIIFYRKFDLALILYYLLLLISPTIGSMIGINLHR